MVLKPDHVVVRLAEVLGVVRPSRAVCGPLAAPTGEAWGTRGPATERHRRMTENSLEFFRRPGRGDPKVSVADFTLFCPQYLC